MSIVEKLTEGIVNRDMKKEGAALLSKWEATGLLEGLQTEHDKNNMARLLENQAKSLLKEVSTMGGGAGTGDVEGFAAVAFPIVRRVFAGLIANDLVSVQPMSLPSGLIFFLDFTFGVDEIGGSPRMGNTDGQSLYGTNQVAKGIQGGVDLVDSATGAGFSGPLRDGATGYAYGSPSGSNNANLPNTNDEVKVRIFLLDGAVSDADKKLIKYDPDLLSLTDSTGVIVVDCGKRKIASDAGDPDFDNLSAFVISTDNGVSNINSAITGLTTAQAQIRRLTSLVRSADSINVPNAGEDSVRFVFTAAAGDASATATGQLAATITAAGLTYPVKDQYDAVASAPGALVGDLFALENNVNIPEINIKVDSIAITAQTKKLKAKWTPELGQDLNAYHNLDAEVELTSILSEQIALEIDREILADLVNGAKAATYYWSRSPGLFVNRETGAELGAASAAPDFTGTVSEWYETLIETINDVSAQIHRKTLRGGANYVVCSPEVANILEFTAGFRANVTADADKGDIGAVNVGSLSRKFDVIVDPYFPRGVILVGRRGNSFLESGYVYAPYVPLQTTPTIFGPEDFVPRKGVMTRYAKKMVRPDMYGLVICRGLLGEEGAS